ncbi:MAG: hypothetical protein Q8R92_09730 [Deltaproteobacteria bacterium]|nr:hypothetical protein [Deltaproteobacteria bacterium]
MTVAFRNHPRIGWYGHLATPRLIVMFHKWRLRFYRHGDVVR